MPFSFFGQDLAPYLWLWVARAGGLLGCVMAYRMAIRLVGGRVFGVLAGVSAFAALLSSNKYVRDAALGNSEPILAAVVLWGVRAPPRRPPRPRALPRRGGGAAAPRGVAVPRRCTASGCGSTSRELRKRLVFFAFFVPACWILPEWWGARRPVPRRLARQRAEPGQRRVRRAPGVGAVQALRGEHRRAGRAGDADRRRRGRAWRGCEDARTGRRARARGARLLVVRARGGDDRGGLRRQPALPDGHDRRGLRARRRGRGARAPGRGDARRRAGSAARGRARARPSRARRRASRSPRPRSSPRPTTPAACRAASSTRRSCGTT